MEKEEDRNAGTKETKRPGAVTAAAAIQLLFAAIFVIAPIMLIFHGPEIEAAGQAELVRQGFPGDTLRKQGIHFDESLVELSLPFGITAVVAALGFLNLAGKRIGWILTMILQPLVLTVASSVIAAQVFAAQSLEAFLRKSGDPNLARIDAHAFIDAIGNAFPSWFYPHVTYGRLALSTIGSAAVIILLLTPRARNYFKARTERSSGM